MASEGKKVSYLKDMSDECRTFTESGNCDDEVTLIFEGDKKLYASKNFLRYASPVFEAMFNHDWKEGKKNCVELKGKKYDDFLEFLLCLHPRILKSITGENVLQIVGIADEYQVTSIITKCKENMIAWLNNSLQQSRSGATDYLSQAVFLRPCLQIVAKAHELSYKKVFASAVKTIAKFGHILYNKGQKPLNQPVVYGFAVSHPADIRGKDKSVEIKETCMNMFNELPLEIKYKILAERLICLDNDKTKLL